MLRAVGGENSCRRSATSEEAGLGVAPHSPHQPAGSCSLTTIAWTGAFSRAHSVRIQPSAVSGSPAPPWVVRSPVVSLVATPRWSPATALPDWSFCGAQRLGKTGTLVPSRWSFARRHRLGTLADWWGLQRHCGGIGGWGLFAPQLTLSRVLVGAGVTPAVHSHGPASLAPVATADRKGAHGRVNSDRAVDCPCSRLIRPQGPHPRTAAWRTSLRKSHAVGCCWLTDTQWTASSTAGRFRRLGGSVKATPAGKYVPNVRQSKRAAHTPPTGPVCVLLYCPLTC